MAAFPSTSSVACDDSCSSRPRPASAWAISPSPGTDVPSTPPHAGRPRVPSRPGPLAAGQVVAPARPMNPPPAPVRQRSGRRGGHNGRPFGNRTLRSAGCGRAGRSRGRATPGLACEGGLLGVPRNHDDPDAATSCACRWRRLPSLEVAGHGRSASGQAGYHAHSITVVTATEQIFASPGVRAKHRKFWRCYNVRVRLSLLVWLCCTGVAFAQQDAAGHGAEAARTVPGNVGLRGRGPNGQRRRGPMRVHQAVDSGRDLHRKPQAVHDTARRAATARGVRLRCRRTRLQILGVQWPGR